MPVGRACLLAARAMNGGAACYTEFHNAEAPMCSGGFLSALSFSHSVALNDRSENPKSKATIDGLHTAARLLKTWSKTPAQHLRPRVCTGVGHGTHLGTNNNKYESAMHRLDRDRAVAHACWSSD